MMYSIADLCKHAPALAMLARSPKKGFGEPDYFCRLLTEVATAVQGLVGLLLHPTHPSVPLI